MHPPFSVIVSAGTGTEELALTAVLENFHCPNCFYYKPVVYAYYIDEIQFQKLNLPNSTYLPH
jgi:hypothetical protein